jgi:hypothetical protein
MVKAVLSRLRRLETQVEEQRKLIVVKDYGKYSGACGKDLSQKEFDDWSKQQDKNVQVLVVVVPWTNCEEEKNECTSQS